MPSLNSVNVVSPLLSGAAIGAAQQLRLVASGMPQARVPATSYHGQVFIESSASFMGSPTNLKTSLTADYPRTQAGDPTTVSFTCEEYKLASAVIPDKLMERSQFPADLLSREAAAIGRKLALDMESRLATLFFSTGNWPDAALVALGGGGIQWSNYTTAKPDLDIDVAMVAAREGAYGRNPDTIILGQQVIDAYRRCLQAQGVAVVGSGAARADLLTEADAIGRIQSLFGLRVLVGSARSNTSAPGLTPSGAYLWGKSFWIGCLQDADVGVAGSDVMVRPVGALLIVEDRVGAAGISMDGLTLPIAVSEHISEPPQAKGRLVAGECYTDEIVCDANLGYLVTAVAA